MAENKTKQNKQKLNKLVAENLLNFPRGTNLQIQNTEQTSPRIGPKKKRDPKQS